MALEIRTLREEDYDNILIEWWKDWGWEPVQKDFLPQNGAGGLIVYDDDVPVCAGFIYLTNSSVAWVDWIISSKTYRKKPERSIALRILIMELTSVCKKVGVKYVYALIKHRGLISAYESLGYVKGDKYTQEMIKAL